MASLDKTPDILLVEDDAVDAAMTLRALKSRNPGGRVVHVVDGDEALEFIFSAGLEGSTGEPAQPKVILLDLRLRKINGIEVLRELKSQERTKNIPVVVLTAFRDDIRIVESYKLGVNSYVVKPTDGRQYAQMIGDVAHYWLSVNQPCAS